MSVRILAHLSAAVLSATMFMSAIGCLPMLLPSATASRLPAWFTAAACAVAALNSYIVAYKLLEFIRSATDDE